MLWRLCEVVLDPFWGRLGGFLGSIYVDIYRIRNDNSLRLFCLLWMCIESFDTTNAKLAAN